MIAINDVFADFTQNKTAAMSAKRFNQTKFQLGFMAGCAEKNIMKRASIHPTR